MFDCFSGTIKGKDNYANKRFYSAHAIMLSFEGLPGFYIHSLFGTKNSYDLVKKTKLNRSINRRSYYYDYVKKILNNRNSHSFNIFSNVLNLIDIRKKQIAFHPNATQYTLNLGNNFFGIWRQSINKNQSIFALYNITNKHQKLNVNRINFLNLEKWFDLITLEKIDDKKKYLKFSPYQFMWITNSSI